MKIVRRKSDNVVLYLRPESERVEIREDGLWFGRARALDINATDHEVVTGPAPAQWYIGGMLAYDGTWSVVDEAQYREAMDRDPAYVAMVKEQAEKRASDIVLKEQVAPKLDTLPDEDVATLAYLYDEWAPDTDYTVDEVVRVGDVPYRVIQAHTSQADWEPSATPSLFTPEEIRDAGYVPVPEKPVPSSTQYVQWNGTDWELIEYPLEQIKQQKKDEITALRYSEEISHPEIDTSRESQAMINGIWSAVQLNPSLTVNYKQKSGKWVQIHAPAVNNIAAAVVSHVQKCFTREFELHEEVDACITAEDVLAIDIHTGWPRYD